MEAPREKKEVRSEEVEAEAAKKSEEPSRQQKRQAFKDRRSFGRRIMAENASNGKERQQKQKISYFWRKIVAENTGSETSIGGKRWRAGKTQDDGRRWQPKNDKAKEKDREAKDTEERRGSVQTAPCPCKFDLVCTSIRTILATCTSASALGCISFHQFYKCCLLKIMILPLGFILLTEGQIKSLFPALREASGSSREDIRSKARGNLEL